MKTKKPKRRLVRLNFKGVKFHRQRKTRNPLPPPDRVDYDYDNFGSGELPDYSGFWDGLL